MPKKTKKTFFTEKQGAAFFKHKVYDRYVPKFGAKLGSRDGHVVVCDGYAGPGAYDDGTPGSPLIVARHARFLADERDIDVDLICVERKKKHAKSLESALEPFGIKTSVLAGEFQDNIDEVIKFAGDSPLLAFLDPFGMGAPMDELRRVLDRDPAGAPFHLGPPTEILMNFSTSALRRLAGHLTSKSKNPHYVPRRAKLIERMDEWLGGDWWQEMVRKTKDSKKARTETLHAVVHRYLTDLADGRAWYFTGCSDRWGGPDAYLLALFTNSNQGTWEFNNALSMAHKDFYDWAHADQLPLGEFSTWEADWVAEIAANIRAMLAKKDRLRIGNDLDEMLGSALGLARETHIRKAVKQLHDDGVSEPCPKGTLLGQWIRRAP